MIEIPARWACALILSLLSLAAHAQTASLSIQKLPDQEPVPAGSQLTYTITAINEGPDDAASVAWNDPLPVGLTFSSLSAPAGWSCTTGATVNCSIPSFPPGDAVFTLTVNVSNALANGTIVSNTATISTTTSDPDTSDNQSTANSTVTTAPAAVVVDVTKTGPASANAGTDVSYTITVSNNGSVDLDAATLTDTLPSGETFVSFSPVLGWSCTTPAPGSAGTITCTNLGMPAGTAAAFTLVTHLSPSATGSVSNTATLAYTANGRDAMIASTATTTVTVSADLSVTKSDAPDPVNPLSNIVYTINVTNAGPSNAPAASLTDTLPAGTTFVSLTSPPGWSCTTGGTVSCTNPSFPLGSAVFTLTVQVSTSVADGALLTNTAIASTSADPNSSNNSGSASTTVVYYTTTTSIDPPATVTYPSSASVTVHVSSPSLTPSGNVTLSVDGGSPLTQPLTAGAATFTIPGLAAGVHTLQANYPAQSPFKASSASGNLTVNQAPTTTAITTDLNTPSFVGIPRTFSFAVNAPGGGTPTGMITLSDQSGVLCTVTLPTTQCTVTFSTPGPRTLTAAYSGDANFLPSSSAPAQHQVLPQSAIPALGPGALALLIGLLAVTGLVAVRPSS